MDYKVNIPTQSQQKVYMISGSHTVYTRKSIDKRLSSAYNIIREDRFWQAAGSLTDEAVNCKKEERAIYNKDRP